MGVRTPRPPVVAPLLSGRLKSIVKHSILGLGKSVNYANTGGPILMLHTSYDAFLCKELPFGVAMIALMR